jgi:hypothetical protein
VISEWYEFKPRHVATRKAHSVGYDQGSTKSKRNEQWARQSHVNATSPQSTHAMQVPAPVPASAVSVAFEEIVVHSQFYGGMDMSGIILLGNQATTAIIPTNFVQKHLNQPVLMVPFTATSLRVLCLLASREGDDERSISFAPTRGRQQAPFGTRLHAFCSLEL